MRHARGEPQENRRVKCFAQAEGFFCKFLAFGGIGGIIFPWLVGIIADIAGLRSGMAVNLIPCVGIIVLPLLIMRMRDRK